MVTILSFLAQQAFKQIPGFSPAKHKARRRTIAIIFWPPLPNPNPFLHSLFDYTKYPSQIQGLFG
jgi:hypothetical protein